MELLKDLEETVDRIIKQQEIFDIACKREGISRVEMSALQKTQESLIAHLLFLSDIYPHHKNRLLSPFQKKVLIQKCKKLSSLTSIPYTHLEKAFSLEETFHLRKRRLLSHRSELVSSSL